jgi:hypothetical protein
MPLDFPSAPTTGTTYSFAGRNYIFNGVAWVPSAAPLVLEKLSTGNLTSTSACILTFDPTLYRSLRLRIRRMLHGVTGVSSLVVSTNGGTSWITAGSSYGWSQMYHSQGAGTTAAGWNATAAGLTSQISLNAANGGVGSGHILSGEIDIHPGSGLANDVPTFLIRTQQIFASGSSTTYGNAYYGANVSINAIQIYSSAGNLANFDYDFYGVR